MQPRSEDVLLDVTKNLIAIQSTADNPAGLRAAYEYIREFIRASGKYITIEEFEDNGKPSLLAYRGQHRPERFGVIFNIHLDVVPGKPEQFIPRVEDGKLYGRGAYDMKAAAVVLAQVFCEYVDTVPYALGLQIVTDEESTGDRGTKHQIEQGVRADLIICGECGRATGTYEIANEAKGVAALELLFTGESAHGAYLWRGENAALKATAFVQKVHEHFPVPRKATGGTTIAVTGVSAGGDVHNQTPESATVRIDCRYAPDDARFANIPAITDLIRTIDPSATITKVLTYGSAMYANPHNPLLQELKAAAEQTEGEAFTFVRRNGASDGRFYTEVGDEACEFGIAGERQHGDDEYITIEAFRNYLKTMRTFIENATAPEAAQRYATPATSFEYAD
jgi:succinyl-diaminopimelate desuccinylase